MVEFLFQSETFIKSSIAQPQFIEILLRTRDKEAKQIYVRGLIILIKNFQLLPTEAVIALEILLKIDDQPGIRQMFVEELHDNKSSNVTSHSDTPILNDIREKINSILNDKINESAHSLTSLNEPNTNGFQNMIDRLATHFVKFLTSIKGLCSIASFANSMPGAKFLLPTTEHLILKALKATIPFECSERIYCNSCKHFTKSDYFSASKVQCIGCNVDILAPDNASFIKIELKLQLRNILVKHWDAINNYLRKCREKTNKNIESAYDGKLVKKLMKENENVLTLTLCTCETL